MLSSGTWPHRPFRDVTARPCRQTSLTRTNKPKITNYSCRNRAADMARNRVEVVDVYAAPVKSVLRVPNTRPG
jgi:hypothetical protein